MKPRINGTIKKSISFKQEQLAHAEKRSKEDYLNAGTAYRRSLSGFIQTLVEKDRSRA